MIKCANKYVNIVPVSVIAFGFLCLFMAFNASNNLVAKAMSDDGFDTLGFYSSALIYLMFGISSLFATAVINKIGVKASLVIGSLSYVLNIMSYILPALNANNRNAID